ncbi:MAG: amidohydrolase [Bifidobacteriaceae bacterium]|jgi:predicted amidohydrolase YtcJ|nr:amidohydrolase [Bifidobacteriaceae bacterium]
MILDVVFVNGRFATLDPERPSATTLGVFNEMIVGLDAEVANLAARRVIDLGGAHVVPGFHDAHHHLSARGAGLSCCDVSTAAVASLDDLYGAVAKYAQALGPDEWVVGTGYSDAALGSHPVREALDAAAGGRPVFLHHASGHGGTLNSEAVRRISGDPDRLSDVDSGFVERRPDGTVTGFVAERAVEPVNAILRPTTSAAFTRAIERACAAALADGLTSVTEPGVSGRVTGNGPADFAAYQALHDQKKLGLRVTVMPELPALHRIPGTESDLPGFGLDLGIRSGLGDDWLRLGPVKIFSDGALTSRTAALTCCYEHSAAKGVLHHDPDALREAILSAHLAGWQIATHAIGDAAVGAVIDAYARAQAAFHRPDARHRIEHCGMTDQAAIGRMAELGLIPVPQGEFLTLSGDDYIDAVGPERAETLYRQRSFLEAGIEVPGSSDCPVVRGRPLDGIQALVRRRAPSGVILGPAERLTTAQALRAYTYGSAYAEKSELRKGRLTRGRLADFTVLSDDLLAVSEEAISDLEIVATVVGGQVRHGAANVRER